MILRIKPGNYYTKKHVATMLGVSRMTIHKWCKSGKMKDTKIGKLAPIHEHDLRVFIKKNPSYRDKLPIDIV